MRWRRVSGRWRPGGRSGRKKGRADGAGSGGPGRGRSRGSSETPGGFLGRESLDKEGAEGLVLAMGGIGGLDK